MCNCETTCSVQNPYKVIRSEERQSRTADVLQVSLLQVEANALGGKQCAQLDYTAIMSR